MTHRIKLSTLPYAGSPGKSTADIAGANGLSNAEALRELKLREGKDVVRTGQTKSTAWTRK